VAPARRPRRQASTTSAPEARSASTSSRRSGCSWPEWTRRPRGSCAQRAQRHLGRGQLGHRRERRWQAARVEAGQGGCGLVEAAEQEQPAHRDQTRLQRVGAIGVRLERGRSGRQGARRAAEVAHREGHLGLRDDTTGARQRLVGAEAAGGAPQELAGARVLAELGHGDAAQGKRRRVVAQPDALEGANRVADDEGARGGGDEGVHRDRLLHGAHTIDARRIRRVIELLSQAPRLKGPANWTRSRFSSRCSRPSTRRSSRRCRAGS
jgi:hypothetical protein